MTDKILFRWLVICAVVLCAAWSITSNDFQQGIDLRGGVTLSYEIDRDSIQELREAQAADSTQTLEGALNDTVRVISTRINSMGVNGLTPRAEGTRRILIQAPTLSEDQLEEIKRRMVQLGKLEFPVGIGRLKSQQDPRLRITNADGTDTTIPFNEAEFDKQRADRIAQDAPKIAEWVAANPGQIPPPELYRAGDAYLYVHEGQERPEIVWKPWSAGEAARLINNAVDSPASPYHVGRSVTQSEVQDALIAARAGKPHDDKLIVGGWLYYDPDLYGEGLRGFTGRDISNPRRSRDPDTGSLTVVYDVNEDRQGDFEDYTDSYINHSMCLVLNDEVWSNPNIQSALSDVVQITGGNPGFTQEEQSYLVDCLQSGSLKLRPTLQSEENVDATLGKEAVDRGVLATILGGVLVVVFMIFYYRVSGVVAVIALLLNLGLMVAMLMLFQAVITLPGIAGIILTIGMSVDANILIFERIREELAKGKALIASVQSGFDRAFVTIIDANLTTMITAVILYQYGVGPIKGFAVTLMAGIACALFTALFVAKTIFATALGREWITGTLKMTRWVRPDLRLDFVGKAKKTVMGSAVGIVAALAIFFGSDPYGLDFTGGTIVRISLEGEATTESIKEKVSAIKKDDGATFFPQVQVTKLIDVREVDGKTYNQFDVHLQTVQSLTPAEALGRVNSDLETIFDDRLHSVEEPTKNARTNEWSFVVRLKDPASTDSVSTDINTYVDPELGGRPFETVRVLPVSPEEDPETLVQTASLYRFDVNEKALVNKDEILSQFVQVFNAQLPKKADGTVSYAESFPKLTFVGPNVVADLKTQAIVAIILSLIALILYIWFRFKEIKYGFAAAIAVFHDVIIALGVVVLFNASGLVHVPINLPIIAGFLTIIGYSLNDTIVLFDRVRENLGNVKGTFAEVVNQSINQTLARTLLTSLTTFAVVLVLFSLNYGAESPIEGIAFTLMIGVLVGTYSSIFIASPMVIWLHGREEQAKGAGKGDRGGVGKGSLTGAPAGS